MTKRIAVIGAPSTGKTTLARGLAAKLSRQGYVSEYVSEYVARYIRKYGVPVHLWEQIRVFNKQKEWEDNIPEQVEFMITDSPLFLTAVYGPLLQRESGPKGLLQFRDLFNMVLKETDRYDRVIYLSPVFDVIQDGTRTQDKESQLMIDHRITSFMDTVGIQYLRLNTETPWLDQAFDIAVSYPPAPVNG